MENSTKSKAGRARNSSAFLLYPPVAIRPYRNRAGVLIKPCSGTFRSGLKAFPSQNDTSLKVRSSVTLPFLKIRNCKGLEVPPPGFDTAISGAIHPLARFRSQKRQGKRKKAGKNIRPWIQTISEKDPMSSFTSCSGPAYGAAGRTMGCMGEHPSHRPHLLPFYLF